MKIMSQKTLSPDTEIVLLLCGRFGGEKQEPFQPFSVREYGDFAKWLIAHGLRPTDLMSESGLGHLAEIHEAKLERKRVDFLLGRGTGLALALERWSRGGLWVISRGDADFPHRLRSRLKHSAPPLFYGAGDRSKLNSGGLAIIGSRDVTESALEFTKDIAARCAREGITVVSGGARGVDSAAMQGATEVGGISIGVLANDLLKTSVNRQNRMGLQEGSLVLISPFYPEAGFNAGNAMARNKYIYTLSDRSLVIDSALDSGGTWGGAVENLKYQWVPLYVRTPGEGSGNEALVQRGGLAFTFNANASESLVDLFSQEMSKSVVVSSQSSLLNSLDVEVSEPPIFDAASASHPPLATGTVENAPLDSFVQESQRHEVVDMYETFLVRLTNLLSASECSEVEIADALILEKSQLKVWLKRALDDKTVKKMNNPVRYAIAQPLLF